MKEKSRKLVELMEKSYLNQRRAFLKRSLAHGLYVGQPQVLNFVREHPGCTQTEIAEYLGVSPASIAFSTKRMQKAGLLLKQVDSFNMRRNRLYVPPETVEMLDKLDADLDMMNQNEFEGFSEAELDQMIRFTERMNSNIERLLDE